MEVSGHFHAPATLSLPRERQMVLNVRLGASSTWSGRSDKDRLRTSPGNSTPDIPPLA
jgi:hypothetical protein